MSPAHVAPARRARAARRGMTLIEVIVAITILTGALLVLGAFSAKFSQASSQAHLVITANEIAASRLDDIRTVPSYSAIDLLRSSAAGDTINADGTRFVRVTTVSHMGGSAITDSLDYRLVTVTVSHPAMRKLVTKTTAMAAY